jgi:hypothetical protein
MVGITPTICCAPMTGLEWILLTFLAQRSHPNILSLSVA